MVIEKINDKKSARTKSLELIDKNEWVILTDYVSLVKPIAIGLDWLQNEKSVTAGSILPCLYFIKRSLEQISLLGENHTSKTIKHVSSKMKQAIITAFTKRFQPMMTINEQNKELIIAACSNPNYKLEWMDLEDEQKVKDMFKLEALKYSDNENSFEEVNMPSHIFLNNRRMRRLSSDSLSNEIDTYTKSKETESVILNQFPTVKKMYFRFNTTLASSAPIERAFSRALLIYTPRRNRLSDKNFEMALFLNINFQLKKIVNNTDE